MLFLELDFFSSCAIFWSLPTFAFLTVGVCFRLATSYINMSDRIMTTA